MTVIDRDKFAQGLHAVTVRTGRRIALSAMLAASAAPLAAQVTPSQVTPRSIAPASPPPPGPTLSEPVAAGLGDMPAAADLSIDLGGVRLDGGFPEMAMANADFVAQTGHGRSSPAMLMAAAHDLERAYARRGFILARVTLPPQRLVPGQAARVVVTDGFIEAVETQGVPHGQRRKAMARLRALIGRGHVTEHDIERALLLAGDLPGLHLRSALTRGQQPGGARLIVEGSFDRVSGTVTVDNGLPAALGGWVANVSLAVNDLLGQGEQIYGFAGSQPNLARYGFPEAPLGVIGAGAILPLGHGGVTLGGDLVLSRTRPYPTQGIPATIGDFSRWQVRLTVPVVRDRRQTLRLTGSVVAIRQTLRAPDFDLGLNRDSYRALRFGADWQGRMGQATAALDVTLSHGLGGYAGALDLPLSPQGAAPDFTTLNAAARVAAATPRGWRLGLVARGQSAFGQPQMLPEQFSLDGAEGISTLPSGSLNVDAGVTLRAEVGHVLPPLARGLLLDPYVFAAQGWGWLEGPSVVEQRYLAAHVFGLGARLTLSDRKTSSRAATIGFELGFTGGRNRPDGARVSLNTGVRF